MILENKIFGKGSPVIVIHGLFGMLDNWQSFAKQLGENFEAHTLSMRNHGNSPWTDTTSYTLMAQDILEYMNQNNISKPHIIGHSMGGKTAMHLILNHSELFSKCIVVDISPIVYGSGHNHIFSACEEITSANFTERKEVDNILRKHIKSEGEIQFVFKNLKRDENNIFQLKFNLKTLQNCYTDLMGFDLSDKKTADTPTLFIKGGNSNYIQEKDEAIISKCFTNSDIQTIENSGHWVHTEKPKEFYEICNVFLQSK